MKFLVLFYIFSFSLFAESITTNLTNPKDIETFYEVTSKLRCICLPSLPIKSCSFNNCEISALLKVFIENRIKAGENADVIIKKMLTGFGTEVLDDPVIQKFQKSGNINIVNGVVYGFGEKILAEPDSTFINLTLLTFAILGLLSILVYYKKVKLQTKVVSQTSSTQSIDKYLGEVD